MEDINPGQLPLLTICGERMKSQVAVYCWRRHGVHAEDPSASEPRKWQSLPLLPALLLMNNWATCAQTSSHSFLLMGDCSLWLLPYRALPPRPAHPFSVCAGHNKHSENLGCDRRIPLKQVQPTQCQLSQCLFTPALHQTPRTQPPPGSVNAPFFHNKLYRKGLAES